MAFLEPAETGLEKTSFAWHLVRKNVPTIFDREKIFFGAFGAGVCSPPNHQPGFEIFDLPTQAGTRTQTPPPPLT